MKVHVFIFLSTVTIFFTGTTLASQGISPQSAQGTSSPVCSEFLTSVIAASSKACGDAGRNTACYGHTGIQAQPQANVANFRFDAPGQIAPLASIQDLQLSAFESAANTWGIALLKVQANLPDTAPGQNVAMALFGDVHIQDALPVVAASVASDTSVLKSPAKNGQVVGKLSANLSVAARGRLKDSSWLYIQATAPDGNQMKGWLPASSVTGVSTDQLTTLAETDPAGLFYGAMSSFYFRTGVGASECNDAPANGILVQSPRQTIRVTLSINGVNVTLGSTIEVDAPQGGPMTLRTLEGSATVQVGNAQQTVPAGQQVEITLDANQRASGPPTKSHPYNAPELHNVPLSLLPSQINIVLTKFTANFVPGDRATYYQIDAKTLNGSDLTYAWSNTNGCGSFVSGATPNIRVWHHSDADGCSHNDTPDGSHKGNITVVVTDNQGVSKTVTYVHGSQTGSINLSTFGQ